jgi:hypothetical protein
MSHSEGESESTSTLIDAGELPGKAKICKISQSAIPMKNDDAPIWGRIAKI